MELKFVLVGFRLATLPVVAGQQRLLSVLCGSEPSNKGYKHKRWHSVDGDEKGDWGKLEED